MSLVTRPARYGNEPYLEGRGIGSGAEVIWVESSPEEPCPRCGARSGCAASADGQFIRCFFAVSAHPIVGGGWLHQHATIGASRRFAEAGSPLSAPNLRLSAHFHGAAP